VSNQQVGSTGRKKRRLSAAEKYETFLAVVSGQETQRQVITRVSRCVSALHARTTVIIATVPATPTAAPVATRT